MTHRLNSHNRNVLSLIVVLLMALNNSALAEQPPVVVKTYGQHIGGSIVYTHQVTNNGVRNVVGIAIGLDTDDQGFSRPATREQGELNFVLPAGSEMCRPKINPALISGPTGWTAQIIPIEHAGCYLQWHRPRLPLLPLQSEQTMRLSITVPIVDEDYLIRNYSVRLSELSEPPSGAAYLTGHFSADFPIDGGPRHYNGVMEKLDITPPALTVSLSPNVLRQSEKLVPITASITAKDDYDPAPEIKLESITLNELTKPSDIRDANLGTDDRQFMLKAERDGKSKTGRVYTVIYSATDASGNKSVATATVTVPHDE